MLIDATRDDALQADDATALIQRLSAGEVSARELCEAATARLRDVNGALNAVAAWVPQCGPETEGPLAGVPVAIKDNEDLAGLPTTQGSLATSHRPAAASSPWVTQFLAMGVSPIAKTTLPEFGLTASTESTLFGATRNPWNTQHSVGGSSGGSAALVAAGVIPIAHANDGGGSIRIPAALCGLVGFKPSRGRIVDRPELDRLWVNLVTQGVVTRSVRDTSLYLSAAERAYANPMLPPVGHVTGPDPRRLRIGVLTASTRGLPVDPDTVAAVNAAASTCETLGHHVETAEVPVADSFADDFLLYWGFLAFAMRYAGGAVYGKPYDGRRTEDFTKGLASMFAARAERLPGAVRRLQRIVTGDHRFDVVLSPVVGHPAPPIGYLGPDVDFRTHLVRLLRFTSFTPVQNVTGAPAVSLPLGRSAGGLPIGVHLAAPFGQDARLLSLAYELEDAMPWPTRTSSQRP